MTSGLFAVLLRNMDYDATDIASTYDRGRDHGPEFLDLWMNVVSSHVRDQRTKRILDLGCGTGRFSEALRARFDAEVIGIDPSKKMLAQARSKRHDRRIRYEPGRGESIPVPDNSVDMIFMSMIFHHLDNPALAARECRRIWRTVRKRSARSVRQRKSCVSLSISGCRPLRGLNAQRW